MNKTKTNYLETKAGVEIKEKFFDKHFSEFKRRFEKTMDFNEIEIKLAKILNNKRNEVLNVLNSQKLSLENVMAKGEKYWLENGVADDYNYAKTA